MKKRMLSGFLSSLFAVAFIFSQIGTVVEAYTNGHSASDAVAWANSQINKGLDYDGVYGCQCVDLIYYYCSYLGATSLIGGNACDYANKSLPSGWKYVYSNYQPGDIAVWKTNYSSSTCVTGSYGHVGIIESADSTGFNAINQNYCDRQYCTKNWFYCSDLQCAIRPDFGGPVTISVSWSNYSSQEVKEGKILLAKTATLSNATMNDVTDVGIDVYNSSGTYIGGKSEVPDRSGHTYVNMWYDFNSELGLSITPGTVYKYSFWVRINNKKYESTRETVTCPPVYTVKFDAQGGSTVSQLTVGKNQTIASLPNSTRNGYKLDGWYTTSSGGTKLTTSTKITNNITYYAHWIKNSFSITVSSVSNGTVTISKNNASEGEEILVTAKPATGYTLDKITVNGTVINDTKFKMPAKDVIVTVEFKMLNGWYLENGKYYLYANGNLKTGWNKVNDKWYFMDTDTGVMLTGWLNQSGIWYYLESSGAMVTGWKQINGIWYRFNSVGQMQTGWVCIGGLWYYFESSGSMVTGWKQINGTWYRFNSDGQMQTGWVCVDGLWYYFESSGAMVTGWKKINNEWYRFNSVGVMQRGWISIDGKWYYFYESGKMAHDTTINGYKLNSSGEWIT